MKCIFLHLVRIILTAPWSTISGPSLWQSEAQKSHDKMGTGNWKTVWAREVSLAPKEDEWWRLSAVATEPDPYLFQLESWACDTCLTTHGVWFTVLQPLVYCFVSLARQTDHRGQACSGPGTESCLRSTLRALSVTVGSLVSQSLCFKFPRFRTKHGFWRRRVLKWAWEGWLLLTL